MAKRKDKDLRYILEAMEQMEKGGDTYCDDGQLFLLCRRENGRLTYEQYRRDKGDLLRREKLHLEGSKIYTKRTWDYEVAAANSLAGILADRKSVV